MGSLARGAGRRWRRGEAPVRRRLEDSGRRRRSRTLLALALLLLGTGVVAVGLSVGRIAQPEPVRLDPDGTTAVPRTWFFQHPWVLFGTVEDPRRVPDLAAIGCAPATGFPAPRQSDDMTRFGSRVVGTASISAIAVLGSSGSEATVRCRDAAAHEPLWLMPSTSAPPLTPTAIVIAGFALLVGAALVHPGTADLSLRRRPAGSPRGRRDRRD